MVNNRFEFTADKPAEYETQVVKSYSTSNLYLTTKQTNEEVFAIMSIMGLHLIFEEGNRYVFSRPVGSYPLPPGYQPGPNYNTAPPWTQPQPKPMNLVVDILQ